MWTRALREGDGARTRAKRRGPIEVDGDNAVAADKKSKPDPSLPSTVAATTASVDGVFAAATSHFTRILRALSDVLLHSATAPLPVPPLLAIIAGYATLTPLTVHPFAGLVSGGTITDSGWVNGPGSAARFNQPAGAVVWRGSFTPVLPASTKKGGKGANKKTAGTDPAGAVAEALPVSDYLLVCDYMNNIIRGIDIHTQRVYTFAGTGGESIQADGPTAAASFVLPTSIGVEPTATGAPSDSVVVLEPTGLLRRIRGGMVSTIAGGPPGYIDGPGTAARFSSPFGVAVSGWAAGKPFAIVADCANGRIRRVCLTTHYVSTVPVCGGRISAPSAIVFGYSPRYDAPDRDAVVYFTTERRLLRRCTLATGELVTIEPVFPGPHVSQIVIMSILPVSETRAIVACGIFNDLYVIDLRTGRLQSILSVPVPNARAAHGVTALAEGTDFFYPACVCPYTQPINHASPTTATPATSSAAAAVPSVAATAAAAHFDGLEQLFVVNQHSHSIRRVVGSVTAVCMDANFLNEK